MGLLISLMLITQCYIVTVEGNGGGHVSNDKKKSEKSEKATPANRDKK